MWEENWYQNIKLYYRVVYVRETRLTGIISHIMIGLSLLLLPYPMSYIPRPVLDGLFLYIAITALFGNQMFDRIMLFFTEQVCVIFFYLNIWFFYKFTKSQFWANLCWPVFIGGEGRSAQRKPLTFERKTENPWQLRLV